MRVTDALHVMVTVSRHVIRVENTVTTSNLEALHVEVDLNNGFMSNYFLLSLLVLTYRYFLHFPSPEYMYVNMI